MAKRYMALFLVFFMILAGFAGCKKGGIIITDNEGKTRVLATDEDGETMTDDAGNLIVVVTGADGSKETQKVAPPSFYVLDDVIEGSKFSVALPKGWEQSGTGDISIVNEETDAELVFMIKGNKPIEDVVDEAVAILDVLATQTGSKLEITTVDIAGSSATKLYLPGNNSAESPENDRDWNAYIFEKNGTVFLFRGIVEGKYRDSVDFEAIINSVKFK
jgi:hypothetical protein